MGAETETVIVEKEYLEDLIKDRFQGPNPKRLREVPHLGVVLGTSDQGLSAIDRDQRIDPVLEKEKKNYVKEKEKGNENNMKNNKFIQCFLFEKQKKQTYRQRYFHLMVFGA